MTKSDDSWNRHPEAKVRMLETNLAKLVTGLSENGIMLCDKPRIELHEDGIYISMFTNAGKYPEVGPVTVDVFIPVPKSMLPKLPNEKKDNEETEKPKIKSASSALDTETTEVVLAGDVGESDGSLDGPGDNVPDGPVIGDGDGHETGSFTVIGT